MFVVRKQSPEFYTLTVREYSSEFYTLTVREYSSEFYTLTVLEYSSEFYMLVACRLILLDYNSLEINSILLYRCGEYVRVVLFQELRRKLMNVVSSIFRPRRETTVYVQRINNRPLTGRRRFRVVSKLFILYIYSYPDTMFNLFKPNH